MGSDIIRGKVEATATVVVMGLKMELGTDLEMVTESDRIGDLETVK
jgi:hypothetical protein